MKRICVISGSRADYGPLKPLMRLLKRDRHIRMQLIVTGSHLSSRLGLTYKEIEKDGFAIDAKIDISLGRDTPKDIARSTGITVTKFSEAYYKLRPDIVVVLGDRFEIFGATTAAYICRVPVAHLSGGEVTEGSIDDAFRHCITKMSSLHFTAMEEYRQRVIQLGEPPDRVFNVGELSLDDIKRLKPMTKKELETKLNFRFKRNNLLVTFHPATANAVSPRREFGSLLRALEEQKETGAIFTKSNADAGGRVINGMIERYVRRHRSSAAIFPSLGWVTYISVMRNVDAVVGNSSSGLIEAPSFRVPAINIGDRQDGRVRAGSVIDCKADLKSIRGAFKKLHSGAYKKMLRHVKNPYERRGGTEKVFNVLKTCDPAGLAKKKFYDACGILKVKRS